MEGLVSLLVLDDSRVLLGTREGIGSGVLPFLEKSLCPKVRVGQFTKTWGFLTGA